MCTSEFHWHIRRRRLMTYSVIASPLGPCTLPTDQTIHNRNLSKCDVFTHGIKHTCNNQHNILFNFEFKFDSVFNLEFQPKFSIQLGIPILVVINLGEWTVSKSGPPYLLEWPQLYPSPDHAYCFFKADKYKDGLTRVCISMQTKRHQGNWRVEIVFIAKAEGRRDLVGCV